MGSKYEYVEQPQHYQGEGMSAMDVIRAFKLNFACGNVIKYMLRAGRKPDEDTVRDLEKALWYLQDELDNQRALLGALDNSEDDTCSSTIDLTTMGAREAAGDWGAVMTPPTEPVKDRPYHALEVADIMAFTNASHYGPSTRASELTAFIKSRLDEDEDH